MSPFNIGIEMVIDKEIEDCIYNNSSACGGNVTPLTLEDEQYLPLEIRKEDFNIKISELRNIRTWNVSGGTNGSKYPKEWTPELRRNIKSRDNYTCYLCKQEERVISHHVHHIDYDKHNCDESNLITLCSTCHMKTNSNREYWRHYFEEVLNCQNLVKTAHPGIMEEEPRSV